MELERMIRLDDYVSEYYGRAKEVTICGITFYFSYNTCIGTSGDNMLAFVTRENYSATTGRHKSHIPHNRTDRVGPDTFKAIVKANLIEALERLKGSE